MSLLRTLAILVPTVIAAATGPASAGELCEGVQSLGEFSLDALAMNYTVDHTPNSRDLDVQTRTLSSYLGPGWHTNGLAAARTAFQSQMSLSGTQGPEGVCVGVSSLHVTYGYPEPVRVFVVSKYPEGSCEYAAVLTHEMQHVEIYRSAAFDSQDALAEFVRREVAARLPVRAANMDQAKAAVSEMVGSVVQAVSDDVAARSKARNAEIDTPENYRKVQSTCSAW